MLAQRGQRSIEVRAGGQGQLPALFSSSSQDSSHILQPIPSLFVRQKGPVRFERQCGPISVEESDQFRGLFSLRHIAEAKCHQVQHRRYAGLGLVVSIDAKGAHRTPEDHGILDQAFGPASDLQDGVGPGRRRCQHNHTFDRSSSRGLLARGAKGAHDRLHHVRKNAATPAPKLKKWHGVHDPVRVVAHADQDVSKATRGPSLHEVSGFAWCKFC
mmetsp:Transcript_29329/g.63612  ORF Transcript_29329/g.63612 Transcript_29329/m.63612 type:complete len:215 (+) Transcript_29329:794-1438(+)